jgi:MobA/MobL family
MSLYFLRVKPISRATGARVTRSAAYRAGERISDDRTKEAYNFSHRNDVVHKEIVLPSMFARDVTVGWARDRSTLWNAVESTNRRNARLGREVYVILPPELTPMQRIHLTRRFSQELSDRYGNAVDTTVHLPRATADSRHHHAHLLLTPREIAPQGFGGRTGSELSGSERHARGLCTSREDLMFIRERWAQLMNGAFRDAGLSLRVDHRSYKARGIDREPIPHIPTKILYMERERGVATKAGDDIRRRHRERVEARLKGPDELARVLERHKKEFAQLGIEREKRLAACPKKASRSSLTKEELAQRHHDWYLANRAAELAKKRARYRENAVVIRERERLARLRAKAPTEQQSVERWLEWRKQPHPTVTAEESVRNWLALRERDKQAEAAGKRREIDHSYDHTLDHDHDLGL